MTTAEMEIPRQLRKAAEIIDERGHQLHAFGRPDGPVCLASALAEANGTPSEHFLDGSYSGQEMTEAGKALLNAQGDYVPLYLLCALNNRSTKKEITKKLRDTADKLEVEPTREVVMR